MNLTGNILNTYFCTFNNIQDLINKNYFTKFKTLTFTIFSNKYILIYISQIHHNHTESYIKLHIGLLEIKFKS